MKSQRASNSSTSPSRQLATLIAKFDPEVAKLIRACRAEMRKLLPTAIELVYDNYNFFVIGYGPTERPSDCIVSLVAGANGVGLCFIHGAKLPDPRKILRGSGNQTRSIHLDSADVLARPEVEALIAAAIAQAKTPFRGDSRGKLIVRSVSAKQRPRRKAAK